MPLIPEFQEYDQDTQSVAKAMALLWTYRTRAAIHGMARLLGYQRQDGVPLGLQDVNAALEKLRAGGCIADSPGREGLVRLLDGLRAPLYTDHLAERMVVDLQRALHELEKFRLDEARDAWPLKDAGSTVAVFRLAMFSGMAAEKLGAMAENIGAGMDWDFILAEAAFAAFDPVLFKRVDPLWRWQLATGAVGRVNEEWHAPSLVMADWALGELDIGAELPPDLRLALAEMLLLQGNGEQADVLLENLEGGEAEALTACRQVQAGDFPASQAKFEEAFKLCREEAGSRRQLLPRSIAWLYPLALLAQGTPEHLEQACKFCIGEAGERSPDPDSPWGLWVHAISSRLGEEALDNEVFAPLPPRGNPGLEDLWRLLLAAWLGADVVEIGPERKHPFRLLEEAAQAIAKPLAACRFHWLESQLQAAVAVLQGERPAIAFFVSAPQAAWQQALGALQALAGQETAEEDQPTRLLWALRLGSEGRLDDIEILEQRQGPRGWSKPRPASLAKIAADGGLAPHDAVVARALRPDREDPRHHILDRATAIQSLIGHPAVVLAEAPEQMVELVAGQPELEAVKTDQGFVLRVTPPLRRETDDEDEALRTITLLQDSPLRLRVIKFSPTQRRAAQLLADGLQIPAMGAAELEKTLQAWAGHFQVQGDRARGERQVPPETRLRAELSPVGEDLLLRLVAAPLGPDGPRLPPGRGRSRLVAALGDETVGTRRDLKAERSQLESVLDAFDFLAEPDEDAASCEWLIQVPEQALDLVERLHRLPAITSVDWPRGKHLKVISLDHSQLNVRLAGGKDWFRLEGEAALEEGKHIQLQELLAAARQDGRFIPMGEGIYVALTRSLKQRLGEIGALAEEADKGVRLPRQAGPWLEDALEGCPVKSDDEFRAAMEKLRTANGAIKVPKGLQAELRLYQEEGFRWAMGLAEAGFGGCLADDMGLGKTLQTLAVLQARSKGGPALILAPTSVAANWRAEAERFTPRLDVRLYGEGDREEAFADLGPGKVLIASYTLFQMEQERFCAIPWHTVVTDEAQAIKNAGAKRSQAVFELPGDFRLALSGTPVENRLSELWSIMRFANPGLLGSLERFNERFANPIEKNGDRRAQQLLRRLIAPFILRRTKAQVLTELPPLTELLLSVDMEETEAAHYENLRRQAVEEANRALAEGAGQARMNVLAQLTRLRRAACDPRLATPEFDAEGAKVRTFADLAAELVANGHKALVFSQFVDFLTLLRAPLDEAGIAYQYLDGSTPAAEREERVAAFQGGEGDLFLISLKAGGFGLNLTAADYVVITDPWWNPAAEDQASGRAHRMGQQRAVTVYRMVSKGTVEERILRLHREKRALAEGLLAEGEGPAAMTTEDLATLIRETLG